MTRITACLLQAPPLARPRPFDLEISSKRCLLWTCFLKNKQPKYARFLDHNCSQQKSFYLNSSIHPPNQDYTFVPVYLNFSNIPLFVVTVYHDEHSQGKVSFCYFEDKKRQTSKSPIFANKQTSNP